MKISELIKLLEARKKQFGNIYVVDDLGYGSIPSDKQKCQPKAQHEFTIKGVKIMAASKKDAIKKIS